MFTDNTFGPFWFMFCLLNPPVLVFQLIQANRFIYNSISDTKLTNSICYVPSTDVGNLVFYGSVVVYQVQYSLKVFI